MGRTSIYARRKTNHHRDDMVQKSVKKLLSKLKSKAGEFVWYGSRESDPIRVETIKDGFLIKLSRYFPHTDPMYIRPMFSGLGTREHEIIIEVRDIQRRYNTSKMVYECFGEDSPLYRLARKTFEAACDGVDIKYLYSLQKEKRGYLSQVEEICEVIS